eukprot:NODE_429_length_7612_cov_0.787968.p1 type:complete len:423 gc:universal NODE_429_length_7612_cov_0.787968:7611-6343(-)
MFSIMLIHQNRTHFAKRYLPEELLPNFINFVLWGHEHFCEPEVIKLDNVDILQAGSSIVTSLQPNEAHLKKGNVLTVLGPNEYSLERFNLPNREYVYEQISMDCLPDALEKNVIDNVVRIRDNIEGIDYENKETWPIIRLSILMQDEILDPIHPQRLAKQIKYVANPLTCVSFVKKRKQIIRNGNSGIVINEEVEKDIKMADIIAGLSPDLKMLPSERLTDTIEVCIRREEKDTLEKVISRMLKLSRERVLSLTVKMENNESIIESQEDDGLSDLVRSQMSFIDKEIQSGFKEMRLDDGELKKPDTPNTAHMEVDKPEIPQIGLSSSDEETENFKPPPVKRKTRALASKKPATKKKKLDEVIIVSSDDAEEQVQATQEDSSVVSETVSVRDTQKSGRRRLPSSWAKATPKTVRRGRARKYQE